MQYIHINNNVNNMIWTIKLIHAGIDIPLIILENNNILIK